MSASSRKYTLTCESPNAEMDCTRVTPGSPFIATSTGFVTSASTSCGASPGDSVVTCTNTGETSGNASTGSRRMAA